MPQTIQMQDGVLLQFPDDMPHDAIREAIQTKYLGNESSSVAEPEPALRDAERVADVAAKTRGQPELDRQIAINQAAQPEALPFHDQPFQQLADLRQSIEANRDNLKTPEDVAAFNAKVNQHNELLQNQYAINLQPELVDVPPAPLPERLPGQLERPATSPEELFAWNVNARRQLGLTPQAGPVNQSVFAPAIPLGRIDGSDPMVQSVVSGVLGRPVRPGEAEGLAAVANQLLGFAEFAESPGGLATAVIGAAGAVPARIIAALYGVDMARQIPEIARNAREKIATGTPQEKADAYASMVTGALMPGLLAKAAVGGRAVEPLDAVAKETALEVSLPGGGATELRYGEVPGLIRESPLVQDLKSAGAPLTAKAVEETKVVASEPTEPTPPEAPTPPPEGSAGAAVAGAGKGIVQGLYDSMWKRLQAGKYPEPMRNPTGDKVFAEFQAGRIKSAEDIQRFVNEPEAPKPPTAPSESQPIGNERTAVSETIPINPRDIQVGDRIFTTDYGYITVEKVSPYDPKYPRSQIVETDRGRRDFDPTGQPIRVDRPPPPAPSGAASVKLAADAKILSASDAQWEFLGETLRDNADSFSPARSTGRIDYELQDAITAFLDEARAKHTDKTVAEAWKEFKKTSDLPTSQMRKIGQVLKSEGFEGTAPGETKVSRSEITEKPEGWTGERWETFKKQRQAAIDAQAQRDKEFSASQAPGETKGAEKAQERLQISPRTDGMVNLHDSSGHSIGTFKTVDEASKAAIDLGYDIAPGSQLKPSWQTKPQAVIDAEQASQAAFEKLGAAEKGAYDKSKRKGMTKAQLAKLDKFDALVAAEQKAKQDWKATKPQPPQPPGPQALGIVPPKEEGGPTIASGSQPSAGTTGVTPLSLATQMIGKTSDLLAPVRDMLKTSAGETMPRTTVRNREAGEAGARYGQSQFYSHYAARALSESVLPIESSLLEELFGGPGLHPGAEHVAPRPERTGPPPIDPSKLGALFTEDALRGRRNAFMEKGRAETDPDKAAKWFDMANNVGTVVGRFGIFRNEAALREFIARPEVQEAVRKTNQLYRERIDPLAEEAGLDISNKPAGGGLLPEGSFLNLFVPHEGGMPSRTTIKTRPATLPTPGRTEGAGTPNLTATMKKRSRFGLRRTGASEIYGVDFHDMIANAFGGFTEIARKNEFDKALVDAGLAKIQEERPGQNWTNFPYEKRQVLGLNEGELQWRKSTNKNIWVKNEVAKEYTNVSNVYRNEFSNTAIRFLTQAVSKFQMLGILDATFHSTALLRRLWEAPLGKGDTALSLIRPLALPKRLSMLAANIFEERLSKNERLANLANIGGLTGHGQIKPHQLIRGTVNFLEENIRLTLSDMYDHLVKEGAPDTETARREYINAGLQYNRRFQGPWMNMLRKTMIGPFVTAGRAGLARGVRRWFLHDWIPGQDGPGKAWIAANILSKMAGTGLILYVGNKAISGSGTGRPGTPLGNLDSGENDPKTGRPLSYPVANLLGSEMRGGRVLGIRALAEGVRDKMTPAQIFDSMWRDSFNAITHPILGPAVQFAYGAVKGEPTASGAPAYPAAAPGKSQAMSNLKHAGEELNPPIVRGGQNILSHITSAVKPAEKSPFEAVKSVLIQQGRRPITPEEKQKMILGAQMRKYTDYLSSEARKLPLGQRTKFVMEQFKKDELSPSQREQAMKQIKEHGVFRFK